MKDQIANPLGGYGTAQTRDATMRTQERALLESGSEAFREGQHNVNALDYGRNAMLAGLTQSTTQTGSSNETGTSSGTSSGTMSGSGTTVQSQPLMGTILGSASQVGAAALGPGGVGAAAL